jgi:putative DNA primase/helicase
METVTALTGDTPVVAEANRAAGTSPDGAFPGQIIKAVLGKDEFGLTDDGLHLVDVSDHQVTPIMLICAPLRVVADSRDIHGKNWGRILEFRDKDGTLQQCYMKMQDLKRDGDDVVDVLLSRGLSIAPGKKARLRLVEYIQNSQPENLHKARSTEMTGWHGNRFVLPDEVLGDGDETIIYQGRQTEARAYDRQATAEDWQANVGRLCIGNSRLVLAVATCFAAPLLPIVGMESGGFHFVGTSSTGKSTALHVAASVMGQPKDYIQSWRATSNGLEGIAKFHNHSCLMLDELSQVQPKEAGEIAYMLANGSGKLRANIKGEAREKASWELLFLSSGEVTLAEHMHEGGKRARAGQGNRLVDIQADAGKGMGIFENIHDLPGGAAFSDALKSNARLYHGEAFRSYILKVISDDAGREQLPGLIGELVKGLVPNAASEQVQRVANRFALIAAAGELATQYGITGWEAGEAARAATVCFQSWISLRGGVGNQETENLLAQVRGFFEQYGDSRFVALAENEAVGLRIWPPYQKVNNRAGFYRRISDGTTEYYVLPEAFREICSGFSVGPSAKLLVGKGIITPANDGKSQRSKRLPGMGVKKYYHFNGLAWE